MRRATGACTFHRVRGHTSCTDGCTAFSGVARVPCEAIYKGFCRPENRFERCCGIAKNRRAGRHGKKSMPRHRIRAHSRMKLFVSTRPPRASLLKTDRAGRKGRHGRFGSSLKMQSFFARGRGYGRWTVAREDRVSFEECAELGKMYQLKH